MKIIQESGGKPTHLVVEESDKEFLRENLCKESLIKLAKIAREQGAFRLHKQEEILFIVFPNEPLLPHSYSKLLHEAIRRVRAS